MATNLSGLLCGALILDLPGADSRKRVLQTLSNALAEKLKADPRDIMDAVLERENLGSTGVGDGVAIPHARIDAVTQPMGAFVRLARGVDFDAIDERPCDLIFMLLAPHNSGADHLRALAQVSRAFRNEDLRTKLRQAGGREDLTHLLCPEREKADAA